MCNKQKGEERLHKSVIAGCGGGGRGIGGGYPRCHPRTAIIASLLLCFLVSLLPSFAPWGLWAVWERRTDGWLMLVPWDPLFLIFVVFFGFSSSFLFLFYTLSLFSFPSSSSSRIKLRFSFSLLFDFKRIVFMKTSAAEGKYFEGKRAFTIRRPCAPSGKGPCCHMVDLGLGRPFDSAPYEVCY